ncbi:helix-turn-helix domain-containing protein [Nonomuraea sp. SBT364]|uniref:helix-turn-helix domain-containing protein n=1 Tax=Nonomuraea sp. SBT364 TaxID=1580530 RepID=UPI00066CC249|nr:AraC family transcriptional regulator [Nonomuraea sp. SBT364]
MTATPPRQWTHYLTPGPAHRKLGLVCLGVGRQEGSVPTVGPRVLGHHVAVLVTDGRGWFSHGGGPPVDVVAPAVIWLLPGVEHHYAPYEPGWSEWFVDFAGPAAAAYQDLGFVDAARPVTPLTTAEPAARAIGRIAQACHRGSAYLEVETSAIVPEVLVALRHSRADEDPHGDPVLAGLARDACLPVSVAEHARRLGMPLAELRQAVRRLAGCSPKDYLMSIRLNRAKDLLAGTDLPVAAVARRVGYDDAAYFTRLFTRRAGQPPSEFRAQQNRGFPAGDARDGGT